MATYKMKCYRVLITSCIAVCGTAVCYLLHRYMDENKTNERLERVEELFEKRKPLKSVETAKEIYGRIKYLTSEDKKKENINDNTYWLSQSRSPCSWVIGSCGLYELSQYKSDYDKLLSLGWSDKYIQHELQNNDKCYFNLYLFPDKCSNYRVIWAKWDGLFQLLQENEYEIFKRIKKFKQELKQKTWHEIEKQSDFAFDAIDDKWHKDPRYLSKDKFLSIPEKDLNIVTVRFFLYCYMCVSKYFSGDGYTVDKNGKIGCKEYLIKNMRICDIPNIKVIQLKVESH